MQKLLAMILACCAGCATLKAGNDGFSTVDYQGTASGAALLLAEQNRRIQTLQAGEVAIKAIDKKMPTTLGQDMARSDVQAGWMMPYGMMGMGGMFAPGLNPANMTVSQVEMNSQFMYPQIGTAPVYYQPGQPQVVQTTGGTADSKDLEEIRRDLKVIGKKVFKK